MRERAPIPLFDLGNVIVKVDFSPFVNWLAARSADKDLARARDVLQSSLISDFESGNMSREEFARRLSAMVSADFTMREAEDAFCSIFPGLVPGMVELLRELSDAGPVYCLSNTNEVHLDWLRRHLPECIGAFTKVFASHQMGERKPNPGIYRSVAEALDAPPGRIVFFDDLPANVEGAACAGMRAHLFQEAGGVRHVLKGNLVSGDNGT